MRDFISSVYFTDASNSKKLLPLAKWACKLFVPQRSLFTYNYILSFWFEVALIPVQKQS